MQKPKPLKKGSRVAIIAPCSAEKPDRVRRAERIISEIGLIPVIYPGCFEKKGYLSGSDKRRAADFNHAFTDDSIDGIIALRGGYGSMRILNMLDYGEISKRPKVFVGYSDVTALHLALNQKCDMVTFHGLMASAWKSENDFTMTDLKNHIFGFYKPGEVKNPIGEKIECIVPGNAKGPITGGNLCMLAATLGTEYEVDVKGKILFMEEIGEEPYRVDRMLNSLALAGKFKEAQGIILGPFKDCEPEEKNGEAISILQILREVVVPFKKPMISNLRAGHINPQTAIPMGIQVYLDADEKKLTFLEAGCSDFYAE